MGMNVPIKLQTAFYVRFCQAENIERLGLALKDRLRARAMSLCI